MTHSAGPVYLRLFGFGHAANDHSDNQRKKENNPAAVSSWDALSEYTI